MSEQEPTEKEKKRSLFFDGLAGVTFIGVFMFFPSVGEALYSFWDGIVTTIWGWFGWTR